MDSCSCAQWLRGVIAAVGGTQPKAFVPMGVAHWLHWAVPCDTLISSLALLCVSPLHDQSAWPEREREKQRERETERQTERQRDRQRDVETERQTERRRDRQRDIETDRETDRDREREREKSQVPELHLLRYQPPEPGSHFPYQTEKSLDLYEHQDYSLRVHRNATVIVHNFCLNAFFSIRTIKSQSFWTNFVHSYFRFLAIYKHDTC